MYNIICLILNFTITVTLLVGLYLLISKENIEDSKNKIRNCKCQIACAILITILFAISAFVKYKMNEPLLRIIIEVCNSLIWIIVAKVQYAVLIKEKLKYIAKK